MNIQAHLTSRLLTVVIIGTLVQSVDALAQDTTRKKIGAGGVAGGLTTIATGAALLPEPLISKAAAGVTGIGQGVTLIGLGLWDLFASARTNPDPNHAVLASVNPVVFTSFAGSGQPFDAANAAAISFGRLIDDSRLVDISLRRYYGALNDNNAADAEFQRIAVSNFFSALEAQKNELQSTLITLSAAFQGTSFAGLSTSVAEVLAHRDDVVGNGRFPTSEQFVFDEMQATPLEIRLGIAELARVNASELMLTGVTDADLAGGTIFAALARELGEVDLRELLPQDIALVPEPATLLLLSIGACGFVARSGRRSVRTAHA